MSVLDERYLAEAVTWCGERIETSSSHKLRSTELDPKVDSICLEWDTENEAHIQHCLKERAFLAGMVEQVCKLRHLQLMGKTLENWRRIAQTGRFLLFECSGSMRDGLAMGETEFFDGENTPAWDSWVQYTWNIPEETMRASLVWKHPVDSLLCWVPQRFIAAVDKGIKVNAEGCLQWSNDPDVAHLPIVNDLREFGLI